MDPLSAFPVKNILLPHHERPLSFLYISPPIPSLFRTSLFHQNQLGKAVFLERGSLLSGSYQWSLPLDHFYSNQRGSHQSINDHPALFTALRQQQEAQGREAQRANPLDRVLGNDTCTLCKEHCFMIAQFVKHHNELREDFIADSRSKRKKLEKRKKEIEGLKEKCEHLEEAIKHIQSITESMQAEASTKVSEKEQQKDDQMEDTVNQFWS